MAEPAAGADRVPSPRVVAIVLNWCGEDDTAACLESLAASDYPALEVLLVDNGSPDGSGERLRRRFPELPYIQTGENLGYTGGNNRGIEEALARGADYVLVLNNDTVVEREAIGRLVGAAEAASAAGARVGAVAPKILYYDEPDRTWFAGGELLRIRVIGRHIGEGERDVEASCEGRAGSPAGSVSQRASPRAIGHVPARSDNAVPGGNGIIATGGGSPLAVPTGQPQIKFVTFLTGCCLLLPASTLRAMGAFDDSLFAYLEDVELGIRLQRAGYELLYVPGARILHRIARGRGDESPWQVYQRERNRLRVMRKHYRGMAKLGFYLFFVPSRLARTAQYVVRGRFAHAASIWKGMLAA